MSTKTLGIKKDNVCRWTWGQFTQELAKTAIHETFDYACDYSQGDNWDLGVTWSQAKHSAIMGDNQMAAKASTILDKIHAQSEESIAFQTVMSVTGGAVNVGQFLANHPDCMISRQRRQRQARQVNIYVCTNSSAAVNARELLERGVRILGLLEALRMAQITVDLFLVSVLGASQWGHMPDDGIQCDYATIEMPSRPLDLATLGFAIAHPAFDRQCMHGLCAKFGYTGGWAKDKSVATVRRVLGMQPQDLYIPEVYNLDPEYKLLTNGDPNAWIDKKMSQIINQE